MSFQTRLMRMEERIVLDGAIAPAGDAPDASLPVESPFIVDALVSENQGEGGAVSDHGTQGTLPARSEDGASAFVFEAEGDSLDLSEFKGHLAFEAPADLERLDELLTPLEGEKDLYLIDSSLPDIASLVAEIPEGAWIEYIDNSAGWEAPLQEALNIYEGLETIHILSHSAGGQLHLGSETFTVDSIASHASLFSAMGHALADGGDILLYGCNLAASADGEAMVEQLAYLTGADVAASKDVTGVAGDWDLEYTVGRIESQALQATNYQYNADSSSVVMGDMPAAMGPANVAPTATNMTHTVGYTEGDPLVSLIDIVVSDVDAEDRITATLTLNDTSAGRLTAGSGHGESYHAGTGVWTVTGTVSQVNAALAGVAFVPGANVDTDTTITSHIEDAAATGPADGIITLDFTPLPPQVPLLPLSPEPDPGSGGADDTTPVGDTPTPDPLDMISMNIDTPTFSLDEFSLGDISFDMTVLDGLTLDDTLEESAAVDEPDSGDSEPTDGPQGLGDWSVEESELATRMLQSFTGQESEETITASRTVAQVITAQVYARSALEITADSADALAAYRASVRALLDQSITFTEEVQALLEQGEGLEKVPVDRLAAQQLGSGGTLKTLLQGSCMLRQLESYLAFHNDLDGLSPEIEEMLRTRALAQATRLMEEFGEMWDKLLEEHSP